MADKTPVVHIIGGESLLGREVVDVLGSAKLPAQVKVVAAIEPDRVQTRYHDDGAPAWLATIKRI